MSKFTHHSQPQAVSDPFSTAPPPQLNAFPASGHTSQPLVASSLTAPPPQLTAFPASGHISQPLVASSVSAEHFASQDFNKSAGTSTRPQPHNITSQPHAAPEQLATQQQGISQLAQHSATVLNIPAICDSKIQIDATTFSLCTNPEQSSSPRVKRMLTTDVGLGDVPLGACSHMTFRMCLLEKQNGNKLGFSISSCGPQNYSLLIMLGISSCEN